MFLDTKLAAANPETTQLGEIPTFFSQKQQPSPQIGSTVIRERLSEAEADLAYTLEVEHEYRQQLSQKIAQLKEQLAQALLDERFPRLNLDFLSWTTPKTVKIDEWRRGDLTVEAPRFSVFTIDSPHIQLTAQQKYSSLDEWVIRPYQLGWLKDFYKLKDLVAEIRSKTWTSPPRSFSLTDTFKGRIPTHVKATIREVGAMFDDIVLVREATWDVNAVTAVFDPDPLVVGILSGKAWLIDAFDVTPAEQFIKDNFTVSEA